MKEEEEEEEGGEQKKMDERGNRGIEPRTSSTRTKNHTTRPAAQISTKTPTGTRTRNPMIRSHMLCPLSHRSLCPPVLARPDYTSNFGAGGVPGSSPVESFLCWYICIYMYFVAEWFCLPPVPKTNAFRPITKAHLAQFGRAFGF
jgi:hypothetical protein